MKGLFKAKPLTPIELVHHIRDLLTYTCPNPDVREAKRQDKVIIILFSSCLSCTFNYLFYIIYYYHTCCIYILGGLYDQSVIHN